MKRVPAARAEGARERVLTLGPHQTKTQAPKSGGKPLKGCEPCGCVLEAGTTCISLVAARRKDFKDETGSWEMKEDFAGGWVTTLGAWIRLEAQSWGEQSMGVTEDGRAMEPDPERVFAG